jgi:hypothetical protein
MSSSSLLVHYNVKWDVPAVDSCGRMGRVRRSEQGVVDMPANCRAGRACPVHYRYSPAVFDRPPQFSARTAYIVGGLYGNHQALDTILAMVQRERDQGGDVILIFNGDFN